MREFLAGASLVFRGFATWRRRPGLMLFGMLPAVIAAAIIATVLVKAYSPIHFMLYGVVSVLTCLGVGYLASILLPGRSVDLDGLTVYTRKIDYEEIT